jgi:hypothetical protein
MLPKKLHREKKKRTSGKTLEDKIWKGRDK